MKKLDEVEPRTNLQATPASAGVDTSHADYHFIINQPGSYYLSANLVVTKTNGIQINAEGVTLDLNGFQVSRATPAGSGIEIPDASLRATVRNGTIKGFVIGIFGMAKTSAFRDLAVAGCTSSGISAGEGAILESCRARNNSGGAAISAGKGSTLSNCVANGNTTTIGINASSGCVLTNCSAYGNTGTFAISVSTGCVLTNCSASFNTGEGSPSAGINATNGSTLTNCTAYFNTSNATTPTFTSGMGFSLGSGCTIQNSVAQKNLGDAIRVTEGCLVRENDCGFSSAGIHLSGGNNWVEGNNVMNNTRGIHVDGTRNLIIKNSASNNTTDYVIAGGNRYGPIVDISAGWAAAVSGKSADDSTMTTHPWANFSY